MNKIGDSKGFAYTTFAILSATILMSILFGQVYQSEGVENANAERIGEASFFLDSVLSDSDRALKIAARRSFTAASDHVVTEGEGLVSPEKNLSEILVNSTLDGEEVETVGNASLSEWSSRVSTIGDRSGYQLSISVINRSFNPERFITQVSFKVKARLFDPTSLASFNRTESAIAETSIEGLEDPMITLKSKGRYTNTIERCGFEDPAEKLYETSQNSSSIAHGEVVVKPSDGQSIDNQTDKILVIEDPDSYDYGYTSGFNGVIAAQESSSPGSVNSDYALGAGDINGFSNGTGAVIDSGNVWRTGFVRMFKEGCYISSEDGPGFFERLEGEMTGDGGGIETLVDVSELPAELQNTGSAVGYVYFNESRSPGLNEVKGVTDEYSWFRIDDHHVSKWGMEGLTE